MDDASTLRWILIIAGAALIGGLLLFGNPNKKPKSRKPKKRRKPNRRKAAGGATPRQEPTLDGGSSAGEHGGEPAPEPSRFEDPDFNTAPPSEPVQAGQGELPIGDTPDEASEPERAPEPPADPPDKVVVLYLQARDNRKVAGVELLDAAIKSGMEFGEMDIFHRKVEGAGRPLFSMANLEKPGHFEKGSWPTLETKGMTLFMGLPGPMPALDAWDALVATARRMAELLHLDVLDQERAHFTRQREGEIREELRAFEREQLPEG